MNRALQRLPKAEERALVEVACANGLTRQELKCHMTRQHDSGYYVPKKGLWQGERCPISYDLMLCEFCGNLMPSDICPAKVQMIKDKLLNA